MPRIENIVIGGGVVGRSIARELAEQGSQVTLLEQFALPTSEGSEAATHDRGSSHGDTRMFRYDGGGGVMNVLGHAADDAWNALSAAAGKELRFASGGLDVAARESKFFQEAQDVARAIELPFELLESSELRARYPQLNVDEGTAGIFRNDTKLIYARQALAALSQLCLKAGADLRENCPVTHIEPGDRVSVTTPQGILEADRVFIATGAWLGKVLETLDLRIPYSVTQEQFAYFEVNDPKKFMPDQFPVIVHAFNAYDNCPGYFLFPHGEKPGIRIGARRGGPAVTADDRSMEAEPARLEKLVEYAHQMVPQTGDVLSAKTCLYSFPPDWKFILDRHPHHKNVIIGGGCSASMFKYAPLFGKALVQLGLEGKSSVPIDGYTVERFR